MTEKEVVPAVGSPEDHVPFYLDVVEDCGPLADRLWAQRYFHIFSPELVHEHQVVVLDGQTHVVFSALEAQTAENIIVSSFFPSCLLFLQPLKVIYDIWRFQKHNHPSSVTTSGVHAEAFILLCSTVDKPVCIVWRHRNHQGEAQFKQGKETEQKSSSSSVFVDLLLSLFSAPGCKSGFIFGTTKQQIPHISVSQI